MRLNLFVVRWLWCGIILTMVAPCVHGEVPPAVDVEKDFLTDIRQLTFEGRRSGEGYYSRDGRLLCFQSEREPGNPFFQIYLLDLTNGDCERVSPGYGKTTCAWIHPQGDRVLFASTHDDPAARDKQKEEMELRAQGKERRYAWDYDEHFELYSYDRATRDTIRLTHATGYDAEGSYSPDGDWIAFASNRHAYDEDLSANARDEFAVDPSIQVDLYRMRADGSKIERLTTAEGYDGGPFFDPSGKRLCFRRFSKDGATAEIFTIGVDGQSEQQLTRMNAMSWAPFFHPSGEYLIFTTNRHGFGNFELYVVAADGRGEPVRVTTTDGFDGLASFSPDGTQITWTSNRTSTKQSQIFVARWDHEMARSRLGITGTPVASDSRVKDVAERDGGAVTEASARESAMDVYRSTEQEIRPLDIARHVEFLCRPELEGRMTGTQGETLATEYVAAFLQQIGLEPAGDDGTYFQPFEFTAGVDLGDQNRLDDGSGPHELNRDWRPLAFSETGDIPTAPIVVAGYGLVAPGDGEFEEYDSYVHLDVTDKWVLVFRYLPEDVSPEQRQHWYRFASLRYKAMIARDRGARGLIVMSGTTSNVREELVRLQFDGSLGASGLPVISVSNAIAAKWLEAAKRDLTQYQKELDSGKPQMGFEIPNLTLQASIDITKVRKQGRNVLAVLKSVAEKPSGPIHEAVLIGAHVDHLGRGGGGSSLATDEERDQIHFGADDNASGVAGVLEIAQYLAAERDRGTLGGRRDVLVVAWSGEELGLLGSAHFAKQWMGQQSQHGQGNGAVRDAYPIITACINLDMIGRFDKKLVLQGVGSSEIWRSEIERRNVPVGLPLVLQDDGNLPTDASTFYTRGIPILSAFTGSHRDYHTPRDTPEKLDYEAAAQISRLMALITRSLVLRDTAPEFVAAPKAPSGQQRAFMRAYLGTIPDYSASEEPGVLLSGVASDGPAGRAGVRGGDLIVELAGRKIANIYDYTYAIEALKVGQAVTIKVLRDGETLAMEVTPGSRE